MLIFRSLRILERSLCSKTMALANKTRTGEVSNRVWMWTETNRVRGLLLTTLAGLQVHHLAPDLCLVLLASTLPNLHRWSGSSLLLKHHKSKLAGCAPLFHLHHPTVSVDSTLPSKRRRSRQWQTAPLSSTGGNSPHLCVEEPHILYRRPVPQSRTQRGTAGWELMAR